jgi:ankyrin repeat protein
LIKAVVRGRENAVKALIESGADINWGADRLTGTALYVAAGHGKERIMRVLLENGADVNIQNSYGRTALHLAVTKDEGVTRALLEANADVNKKDLHGLTPLCYASGWSSLYGFPFQHGRWNEATTRLLLEAGATMRQHNWDAIPEEFRKQNPQYARVRI